MIPHNETAASNMHWRTLSAALEELRDSWLLISYCLSDFLTEAPSELRDEISVKTAAYLHSFRMPAPGSSLPIDRQ